MKAGEEYSIFDPENIWGQPVARGVFDGKKISAPMIGAYAPEFAAYVVVKGRRTFANP